MSSDTVIGIFTDPFLTLFASFFIYLLIILGGICATWHLPIIHNGSKIPKPDSYIQWATKLASFIHSTIMSIIGYVVLISNGIFWSPYHFHYQSKLVPVFVAWDLGYICLNLMILLYQKIEYR